MPSRFKLSRRIVASWILGTALALMSAAAVLADGGGPNFPH
jgi:hypothetical protein